MPTLGDLIGNPGPRLVPIPQPYRVLDEAEMRQAFGAIDEGNELWIAINQLLREYIVQAATDVGDPVIAKEHGTLAHCAGGLEWLGKFQSKLQASFEDAHPQDKGLIGAA